MSIFWQRHQPACTPCCLAMPTQVPHAKSKQIKKKKQHSKWNLIFLLRTGPALAVLCQIGSWVCAGHGCRLRPWGSCILLTQGTSSSVPFLMGKTLSTSVGRDRVRVETAPHRQPAQVFQINPPSSVIIWQLVGLSVQLLWTNHRQQWSSTSTVQLRHSVHCCCLFKLFCFSWQGLIRWKLRLFFI